MSSVQKGLITYQGIDSECFENMMNFKQFNIDNVFQIPCHKPNIEQIVKVWVHTCIEHFELVKTPVGVSLEGQEVTGFKLLVSGDLSTKIEYVADESSQSVHTAHAKIPFCNYVVLPKDFNPNSMIFPSVSVEDIFADQIDCRCVYTNVTMLLVAEIC